MKLGVDTNLDDTMSVDQGTRSSSIITLESQPPTKKEGKNKPSIVVSKKRKREEDEDYEEENFSDDSVSKDSAPKNKRKVKAGRNSNEIDLQ